MCKKEEIYCKECGRNLTHSLEHAVFDHELGIYRCTECEEKNNRQEKRGAQ